MEAQLAGTLQDESGEPTGAAAQLESLDYAFTAVFTVELAVNMASNLWDRFVSDSWCVRSKPEIPEETNPASESAYLLAVVSYHALMPAPKPAR